MHHHLRGLLLAKRSDGTQVFAAERKLAACAQPQHLAGTFRVSASSSSLTLTPESGASLRYRYEKTATALTLYDGATVVGRLGTVPTYCTRSADCDLQTFIHPACVGRAVCTSDQRCGYSCGGDLARGYGDVCGGIAGLQCQSGLSCGLEDDRGCTVTKPFPDQSGVCRSAGCTGYRCATGESCRLQDGAPTCQPDKIDICARVRCRGEQPHCVEAQGESACLAVDACHRDSECPTGQRCQPAITCTREPCFAPLVCK